MPYKDPEVKRRYMSRYYKQKIKTGAIPCTAYRKRSYGLTGLYANKTQASTSVVLAPESGIFQPISRSQALPVCPQSGFNPLFVPKPVDNRPRQLKLKGGAEYRERIPRG